MQIRGKSGLLVIALALAALSLVITTPAQAKSAPQPGKPCATLGAEVSTERWLFTCTMKKGKQVWVRTPKPAPTWQKVALQLATSANARRIPSSATSFDIRSSPTVSGQFLTGARKAVALSYETWHAVAPVSGFPVLFVDERSQQWYADQSATFPGDKCAQRWWDSARPSSLSFSGAVCFSDQNDWGYMVLHFGSRTSGNAPALYTHEFVHVAQWSILGPQAMNRMECWLGEGMAELYTGALTFTRPGKAPDLARTASYRRFVTAGIGQLQPTASQLRSAEYWLGVIRGSENRGSDLCLSKGLGYSLGYLVTEKLVADFGEARLLDWMRLTRETQDSEASFIDVFEVDQDTWYAKSAAPYVAQEASLILR